MEEIKTSSAAQSKVDPDKVWPVGKKPAIFMVVVVSLLGVLDILDRQILSALLPYIQQDWALTDTQLGTLVSAVSAAVALLVVPSAFMIDNWSRKKMVALMGTIWSLATAVCAFVGNYGQLLVARFFVGAGEAGYNPAAQALIAAELPKRHRSLGISITQLSLTLGGPIGLILGGYLGAKYGWRHAFGIVAIPGIILSIMALFIKDYKNKPRLAKDDPCRVSYPQTIGRLLKTPTIVIVICCSILYMMSMGATQGWMPMYFVRYAGKTPAFAATMSACIMLVSMTATIMGGPVIDRIRKKTSNSATIVLSVCLILTAIFSIIAYALMPAGSVVQIVFIVLGGFFSGAISTGTATILVELAPARSRATSISVNAFFQNMFGLAVGPLLTGFLSDNFGLQNALSFIYIAPLIAGLLYIAGSFTHKRDLAKLPKEEIEFEC